jgi:hypothetical protein
LGRQTVKTLRTAVSACEQQIPDGAGDTSVSVVEWVQGDETQVAKSCPDEGWLVARAVEPVEEPVGFCFQAVGRRRLEIDSLSADWARNNLHGAAGIVAPRCNFDLG